MELETERWQFWLDVGGTFTDCLARSPDGQLRRRKVLSSGVVKGHAGAKSAVESIVDLARTEPDDFWIGYNLRLLDDSGQALADAAVVRSTADGYLDVGLWTSDFGLTAGRAYELQSPEEAPILAIRLFLGLRLDEPIPPCVVRLGTTRGTNALLTRRGAKTGFVTTRGFADVLRIGYQNRPKLFELAIKNPEPLFAAVAEIDERIAADGSVLLSAHEEQIREALSQLKAAGVESLSICLLNSYANPQHEREVELVARHLGFEEISVS